MDSKNLKSCSESVLRYSDMAYRGDVDLISNMPPEIIAKILTHLPVIQAVRTSVLARTWRYKWTSMPDFIFAEHGAAYFVKFVNGFFRLHQCPIRKFNVLYPTLNVWKKLHQWMYLVLRPDLEVLQIGIGRCNRYPLPRLPLDLFNCKRLNCLTLSHCELHTPHWFEGFLNLKTLRLSYTEVDSKMGVLFSKSPLLESLTFDSCSSNDMITISAPNLKYFELMRVKFKDIFLENATVLVDMIIGIDHPECKYNVIKLLDAAPNLERLTIHFYFKNFNAGFYRGELSTTFNYLKIMKLGEVCLQDMKEIPLLMELLTSAPNLEKLVLVPRKCSACRKRTYWWPKFSAYPPPLNGFMKLKVIEMLGLSCDASEIKFAKFMLQNSPNLEKMELRSSNYGLAVRKLMDEALANLSRVSDRAKVTVSLRDRRCTKPF